MQDMRHIPTQPARPAQAHPSRSDQADWSKNKTKSPKKRGRIVLCVIIILVVAALATLVVFQWLKLNNSAVKEEEAARNVQNQVAKIMILPGEDALVSDIDDAEKVKDQPFFAQVQNGDKVLVFVGAAKIVIYRPSENKIVNSGPIVNDTLTNSTSTDEQTTTDNSGQAD